MAEQKRMGRKPSASTILANKNKKSKEEPDKSFPTGTIHYCICCGKTSNKSNLEKNFYISYSPFHNYTGRVPVCKECIFKNSTIKGELVIEMFVEVIRMLDKPFINTVFDSAISQTLKEEQKENALADREMILKKRADSVIGYYIKTISLPQTKEMTWLDGDQRYINKDIGDIILDINELGEEVSATDLVYKWGENYTEAEYLYLENRYNTLISMMNVEYESDLMLVRQICIKELQIREIQKKKNDDTKQVEALQKLMATANIRPTDIKNANSDLLNDSYGKWINTIENYEPCEYFADKSLYDDHDGLKKYFENWVLRPLKNLLRGTRDFKVED